MRCQLPAGLLLPPWASFAFCVSLSSLSCFTFTSHTKAKDFVGKVCVFPDRLRLVPSFARQHRFLDIDYPPATAPSLTHSTTRSLRAHLARQFHKMQFSKILFAILPALALAEDGQSTTTCTSSTTITKTMTLSEVHTVTSTLAHNTTTSAYTTPSVGTTSHFTSATVVPTTTGGEEQPPTVTDDPNAAPALDATRVVLAGVLGMAAVAMM